MPNTPNNASAPQSKRQPKRSPKQIAKETCLKRLEIQIQQYPPKDSQELELINQRLTVCVHSWCNSSTTCQCKSFNDPKKCLNTIFQDTQLGPRESNSAYVCANYRNCNTHENCEPTFFQSLDEDTLNEYEITIDPENTSIVETLYTSEEQVYICPARLKACRISSGLTFSQIESLSWVTRGWLSRCEHFSSEPPHKKVKIEKALCYLLAALYGTTPGYLMGHTNSIDTDLFTVTYRYRRKGEENYQYTVPTVKELSLRFYYPVKERVEGFKAMKRLKKIIKENPDLPERDALFELISKGNELYFTNYPKEIQKELNKFLTGLIHITPGDSSL